MRYGSLVPRKDFLPQCMRTWFDAEDCWTLSSITLTFHVPKCDWNSRETPRHDLQPSQDSRLSRWDTRNRNRSGRGAWLWEFYLWLCNVSKFKIDFARGGGEGRGDVSLTYKVSNTGAPLDHEDKKLEAKRTSTLSTKGVEIMPVKKRLESGGSQENDTGKIMTPFTAQIFDDPQPPWNYLYGIFFLGTNLFLFINSQLGALKHPFLTPGVWHSMFNCPGGGNMRSAVWALLNDSH